MTMMLELSDDLASRVQTVAGERGLSVEAFATMALGAAMADGAVGESDDPRSPDVLALAVGRFRKLAADLAEGLSEDRAPLSDFAVSRAGIYESEAISV